MVTDFGIARWRPKPREALPARRSARSTTSAPSRRMARRRRPRPTSTASAWSCSRADRDSGLTRRNIDAITLRPDRRCRHRGHGPSGRRSRRSSTRWSSEPSHRIRPIIRERRGDGCRARARRRGLRRNRARRRSSGSRGRGRSTLTLPWLPISPKALRCRRARPEPRSPVDPVAAAALADRRQRGLRRAAPGARRRVSW